MHGVQPFAKRAVREKRVLTPEVRVILAALVAAATATAAPTLPPRPPDAVYTYGIFIGDTQIGSSSVAVSSGVNGAIAVKEHEVLTVGHFAAMATSAVDPATLLPTAYRADFDLPNGTQHTDVAIKPGAMTVTVDKPAISLDIAADPKAPVEIIGDNLVGSSLFLPALIDATTLRSFTLAVLSVGKPVVVTVGRDPSAPRPKLVPATDLQLSFDIGDVRENLWYDPKTFVVDDFVIPAQHAEFRLTQTTASGNPTPAPLVAPSALPTPVAHFSSRDVRFISKDGVALAGTLTVPDGPARRRSAVILVHGSGAEDRDETIGPNPVFLQLSNALSNAGYVVLRYDKRGVGKSEGTPFSGTREHLLDDVSAAFDFTAQQPEVDPRRIVLLGHSEGGELVPSVAARNPRVAGLILMAPPALRLTDISMEQVLAMVPPAERAATRSAQRAAMAKMQRSNTPTAVLMRSLFNVDPIVDIKRVHVPILVLQGTGDVQVLAKDLPRLADAARSVNPHVTVRTFSNDNHLFDHIVGGPQTPMTALHQYLTVPAYVDRRVLDTITAWLKRV